jgi:hypothetical protein
VEPLREIHYFSNFRAFLNILAKLFLSLFEYQISSNCNSLLQNYSSSGSVRSLALVSMKRRLFSSAYAEASSYSTTRVEGGGDRDITVLTVLRIIYARHNQLINQQTLSKELQTNDIINKFFIENNNNDCVTTPELPRFF